MIVKALSLILQEDIAASADSTSTGGHRSLNYLPGSLLLGAAARHYKRYQNDGIAWDVFHSGAVRFGNAYPAWQGQRARPASTELTEVQQNGTDEPGDPKMKEARGKFVFDGRVFAPRMVRRQKTAYGRDRRGAPIEGLFFDIEALARGQEFIASLTGDNGDLLDRIVADLTGDLMLGRSRSAEFGRVKVRCTGTHDAPAIPNLEGQSNLKIYCVSDLAPANGLGGLAQEIGLPGDWQLQPTRPRGRTVVGFNGHRRMFTTEVPVIAKGTVLEFQGRALTTDQAHSVAQKLVFGLGIQRAEGFGEILINPDLAEGDLHLVAARSIHAAPKPTDGIFGWADARARKRRASVDLASEVKKTLDTFDVLYAQAKEAAESELSDLKDMAPTRAQWGEVRKIARDAPTAAAIREALFRTVDPNDRSRRDEGLTRGRLTGAAWSFESEYPEGKVTTFRALLEEFVGSYGEDHARLADALFLLANDMPRRLAGLEGKGR